MYFLHLPYSLDVCAADLKTPTWLPIHVGTIFSKTLNDTSLEFKKIQEKILCIRMYASSLRKQVRKFNFFLAKSGSKISRLKECQIRQIPVCHVSSCSLFNGFSHGYDGKIDR